MQGILSAERSGQGGKDPIPGQATTFRTDSYTCAEVKAITLDHLGDIRRKISDLRKLAKVLQDTADLCDGGVSNDCPIVDALYRKTG